MLRVALWILSLLLFGYAAIMIPVLAGNLQTGFNINVFMVEVAAVGATCHSLMRLYQMAGFKPLPDDDV